jgi:hypothetical protein
MREYGTLYSSEKDLTELLRFETHRRYDILEPAYDYAIANHSITQTVNDIEDIISNG